MKLSSVGLFLLLSSASFAQESPFDFKGIALGSDISAVLSTSRFSSEDPKNSLGDQMCTLKPGERETIAGAPVRYLFLYYYSGKLELISIAFDEKSFSQVR